MKLWCNKDIEAIELFYWLSPSWACPAIEEELFSLPHDRAPEHIIEEDE